MASVFRCDGCKQLYGGKDATKEELAMRQHHSTFILVIHKRTSMGPVLYDIEGHELCGYCTDRMLKFVKELEE